VESESQQILTSAVGALDTAERLLAARLGTADRAACLHAFGAGVALRALGVTGVEPVTTTDAAGELEYAIAELDRLPPADRLAPAVIAAVAHARRALTELRPSAADR
jgi:hypothetical protein